MPGSPPVPDFVAGCTLPFDNIVGRHQIDHACTIAGELTADPANQLQKPTKNNFCATGTPVLVTQVTFRTCRRPPMPLPTPFTFGSHDTLPADRDPIRATGFNTTSDGDDVHEGTVVRTVGCILFAPVRPSDSLFAATPHQSPTNASEPFGPSPWLPEQRLRSICWCTFSLDWMNRRGECLTLLRTEPRRFHWIRCIIRTARIAAQRPLVGLRHRCQD